jgi:hypothetical protein
MYFLEIFEVAIGLVFMCLVISVAAMSVQEGTTILLEWRAKDWECAWTSSWRVTTLKTATGAPQPCPPNSPTPLRVQVPAGMSSPRQSCWHAIR